MGSTKDGQYILSKIIIFFLANYTNKISCRTVFRLTGPLFLRNILERKVVILGYANINPLLFITSLFSKGINKIIFLLILMNNINAINQFPSKESQSYLRY